MQNHQLSLSEHPISNANERAREQWEGEIARLALAALRDDEYREAVRQGRIRVLRPIHNVN